HIHERDSEAIRRPMREKGSNRRHSELRFVCFVHPASPQGHIRIRDVRNPLAIGRKLECSRRNTIEVRLEALRSRVVANRLYPPFLSHHEQLFAVTTRNWRADAKGSWDEACRRSRTTAKNVAVLGHDPYGLIVSLTSLKKVVASVRRPVSTTLRRRLFPIR